MRPNDGFPHLNCQSEQQLISVYSALLNKTFKKISAPE